LDPGSRRSQSRTQIKVLTTFVRLGADQNEMGCSF
jgi:hypothetical protein